MKKIILSVLCVLSCITQSLLAQTKLETNEPFKPKGELEISMVGNIVGSINQMKQNMVEAGFGTGGSGLFDINWSGETIYPVVHNNPGYILTFRYQYHPVQSITVKYGVVEDYKLTGELGNKTFDIRNKLSTAAILYTIAIPNQRLKASGGPSYSWMGSKAVTKYHTGEGDFNTSGAFGLNLNIAFSLIRKEHFHFDYFIDGNISGKVAVGPYDIGPYNWNAPDVSISTIKHGLTLGVSF